jgi:hypothetical protein
MTSAWASVAILFAADVIWLPFTRLMFVPSTTFWSGVTAICTIVFYPVLRAVARRTGNDEHGIGVAIHFIAKRFSLFVHAFSFNAALALSLLTFTYLATAAALPLQDAKLAAIDRLLGLDWLSFLSVVNARPHVARLLTAAYHSYMLELFALFLILSATNRAERLSEACAILALVSLTSAVINVFVPAVGPYGFYAPTPAMASNLGPGAGSWHAHLFAALREPTSSFINFDVAQGLVTFPSLHAAWAVITWWAIRDMRLIGPSILVWNGIIILSTIPEGGHYFIDVIAGTAITIGAIVFVRSVHACRRSIQSKRRANREPKRDARRIEAANVPFC